MMRSIGDLEPVAVPPMSLTEMVTIAVRDAIRSQTLVPGELYSVYQLADQLDVSRSPVRDALLRLEQAGLVKFERNRGFRILLPDPHQIAEIFAIRLALEVPAARRVARHRSATWTATVSKTIAATSDAVTSTDIDGFFHHDVRLHDTILDHAGNQRARAIVAELRETTTLLSVSTADGSRTLSDIDSEHQLIIEAIGRSDPDAAGNAMRGHLVSTGQLLLTQYIRRASLDFDATAVWASVIDD